MLLYHLLWELTHVVSEQTPACSLLETESGGEGKAEGEDEGKDEEAVCITCSDGRRVAEVRVLSWRTGGSRCWPPGRRNRSTAA